MAASDTSNNEKPITQSIGIAPSLEHFDLNRTARSSNPDAHSEDSSDHQEQVVLEVQPSNTGGGLVSNWVQWWPTVAFPPAYALHRYYRRHRPRRLPTLTPLKLPGLYGVAFTSVMLLMHQSVVLTEIIDDKRLHIIERAGDRAAATLEEPEGREIFQALTVEPGLAQVLKRVRDGEYSSLGIAGKFAWWDYHIWSNQDMFNKWAILLLDRLDEKQSLAALPREDLEVCATHLANYSSQRAVRLSQAIQWGMGFSVPLAMLARWSSRRALYLPMNGLQRLLIGAWMYVELPVGFRELWYLQRIREKDVASQVMTDLFGSFDEEFEEMGIEYSQRPDDQS